MLEETRYNVLLVSSNEKMTSSISALLKRDFNPPVITSNPDSAKRLLLERDFDLLIINSPVNGENGTRLALTASENTSLGIILLVRGEDYNESFDKTKDFGIITLSKPTPAELFIQSLKILTLSHDKAVLMRKNTRMNFKEKMEEVRKINEAKVLLMRNRQMKEDEAHHYLEKLAMNKRVSKITVAMEIINFYSD